MRISFWTVPLLIAASASAVWAQSPKPKSADPLIGVRAYLRRSQSPLTLRKVYLVRASPQQERFHQMSVVYTPSLHVK